MYKKKRMRENKKCLTADQFFLVDLMLIHIEYLKNLIIFFGFDNSKNKYLLINNKKIFFLFSRLYLKVYQFGRLT